MGQHRALRRAGRAAGVLKHRDIVIGVDFDRLGLTRVVGQVAEEHVSGIPRHAGDFLALDDGEEQTLEARQHLRHRTDHQMGQPRFLQGGAGLVVEEREVEGDEDVRLRILDLFLDLLDGVERVEIDHRPARLEHAEIAYDRGRAVGQEQADLAALGHPEFLESLRRLGRERADLRIAHDAVQEIDRGAVGVAGRRFVQQQVQRAGGNLGMPVDIRRVGFFPGVGAASGVALCHALRSFRREFAAAQGRFDRAAEANYGNPAKYRQGTIPLAI